MSVSSRIAHLEKRLAAEVGPRGGKIIGETKSGKPIYDDVNHESHKKFDSHDHFDAMQAHQNKALEAENHKQFGFLHKPFEVKHHQEQATQHYLKSQHRQAPPRPGNVASLEKRLAVIGPHGGKIIGYTKSRKPIYETANHDAHKDFTAGDHKDAMNLHADQFSKLKNHPLAAVHGDLIDHHAKEHMRHYQKHKNLTNPEPAVYDLTKDFQKN